MMYADFTAGNKDYKLRLSVRATVALERQLGCNPLAIFGKIPTKISPVKGNAELMKILMANAAGRYNPK